MSDLSEMTSVLTWVAAAVLVLAGSAKVRRPSGTVAALAGAGLRARAWPVRFLGLVEVAIGVTVLTVGGTGPAAATAVLYAAFAAFVVRQRRRAGATCGCFGEERTPVGAGHVAVNVVATVAATVGAVTAAPAPLAGVGRDPLAALGAIVLVALAAWLVRLWLTAGAELRTAVALHPRTRPESSA
ncbi:MAG: hypothetical protein KY461_11915 [Actinobacteria bacterium]|nr:hypothetical protein [Actinomycetota bacterium]